MWVEHSISQPTDDKPSVKCAWLRHVTHFQSPYDISNLVYMLIIASPTTDDKLSLKGAWSRHVTHFKFLVPPKISLNGLS